MPILNFPPGVAKFSILRGKLRESKSTIFFLIHLGNPFSITILGRNSTCEAVEARGQFWICPRTASFLDPKEKGGILTLLTSFPIYSYLEGSISGSRNHGIMGVLFFRMPPVWTGSIMKNSTPIMPWFPNRGHYEK